ncbi:hypothetical protein VP01_26g3 [Puccinia sorghi]|uniref:Uncharacterized protein n=1 Tax=Puccinia sorghi TaxID=27349 RepID=A0A0L6V3M1_9BASI|nr:hypothetical protein VP01_26g3 [Puccinia sorghi]
MAQLLHLSASEAFFKTYHPTSFLGLFPRLKNSNKHFCATGIPSIIIQTDNSLSQQPCIVFLSLGSHSHHHPQFKISVLNPSIVTSTSLACFNASVVTRGPTLLRRALKYFLKLLPFINGSLQEIHYVSFFQTNLINNQIKTSICLTILSFPCRMSFFGIINRKDFQAINPIDCILLVLLAELICSNTIKEARLLDKYLFLLLFFSNTIQGHSFLVFSYFFFDHPKHEPPPKEKKRKKRQSSHDIEYDQIKPKKEVYFPTLFLKSRVVKKENKMLRKDQSALAHKFLLSQTCNLLMHEYQNKQRKGIYIYKCHLLKMSYNLTPMIKQSNRGRFHLIQVFIFEKKKEKRKEIPAEEKREIEGRIWKSIR